MAVSEVGMTRREQQIETTIREFLRSKGFRVFQDIDTYAETRGACVMAQAGEMCAGLTTRKLNLTELALDIERAIA
jgi:hypothetical protein